MWRLAETEIEILKKIEKLTTNNSQYSFFSKVETPYIRWGKKKMQKKISSNILKKLARHTLWYHYESQILIYPTFYKKKSC